MSETLEEQLSLLDQKTVDHDRHLYVYARPTMRATYWLLMLRNVFRPGHDFTIDSPATKKHAMDDIAENAVLFNCDGHLIHDFSMEDREPPAIRLHSSKLKPHDLKTNVIEESGRFRVMLVNQRISKTSPVGISTKNKTVAQRHADLLFRFIDYVKMR